MLDPRRTLQILTTVIRAFLTEHLLDGAEQPASIDSAFEEVTLELIR